MRMKNGVMRLGPLSLAIAMAGVSSQAGAAGFALIEQSASGLGNAFAGGAAFTEDASAQYYNPASITELEGTQFSGALHYIAPTTELKDGTATVEAIGGAPVGAPISGSDGGEAGVNSFVPNFYYVRDINAEWKFGLGIGVPFGLATEYDDDWIGRYHAIKSEVETININPAFAFRANDQWSVGFGVSAQYLKANLTSAVDSSSNCLAAEGGGLIPAGTCAGLGLSVPGDGSVDGKGDIEGDSWAYGFNFGVLFKPTDVTRVGFSYRSGIDHDLEGDGDFSGPLVDAGLQAGSIDVEASVDLPSMVSLSLAHEVSPKIEVMGDITWTEWSSFEELVVEDENGGEVSRTTENWDDSFRYSLGLSYRQSQALKWRFGVAYDETPVPDAQHRTPRIPGNDRTWVAVGLNYAPSKQLSWDFGYAHLFVNDTKIDNTTEAVVEHNLDGTYESSVDILSAQVNYKF